MTLKLHACAAALLMLASQGALAEVNVAFEVNRNDAARPEFKFDSIASPSRTDAANAASMHVIVGTPDGNGGGLAVLNDGELPAEEDDPRANFLFDPRSNGGRILVDLAARVDVRQINTYSWHPGGRGPQLYKLYAAAGSADADSASADDLAAEGWKLLAEVDTRPEQGEPGGQYAVSVAAGKGDSLGKIRYLLFDVSRTGTEPWFDNTFFSEIDVVDGREHPLPKNPAPPKPDVLQVPGGYEIVFDASQVPELKPWIDGTLKPICANWYPKIVKLLPSENYEAPRRFTIVFHRDMRGVANTAGRQVNCAAPWFLSNLQGEAAGAVVHELVHVVQQYGRSRGRNRNPGWLVEGVADHIRWFMYEPAELRPRVNPDRAHYTDSYRTTAAFLDYVVETYDGELVKKLNAAMRNGEYRDELWREYTGKTVDELWDEYAETLRQG